MNILIVEDDKLARIQMAKLLRQMFQGIEVSEASDGKEALEILNDKSFGLIITDINMSPVGGIELIKNVRKNDAKISIFALSADRDNLELAKSAGASSIFQKSIMDLPRMLDAIKVVLNE